MAEPVPVMRPAKTEAFLSLASTFSAGAFTAPPGSLETSTYCMRSRPLFSSLRAVRLPPVRLPPSTFACCSARSSATAAEPSTLMAPAFTPQTWALAVAWP